MKMCMFYAGGCGSMFDVTVISPEFKGMSIVKQHRMVTEVSCFTFAKLSYIIIYNYNKYFNGIFWFIDMFNVKDFQNYLIKKRKNFYGFI